MFRAKRFALRVPHTACNQAKFGIFISEDRREERYPVTKQVDLSYFGRILNTLFRWI